MVSTFEAGETVGGKYRIVRTLGRGGMGVVYEAENELTSRRVALKTMLPSETNPSGATGRQLREARAAARIRHRNVVDLYDVVLDQGVAILVMELLNGDTLAHVLSTNTVPVPAFLRMLMQAMRGVAHAHRAGILHRDIKPENIMLAREPDHPELVPKVLDFGVAKLDDGESLTHSGAAVGTPRFMALEQLRGERDLDQRVDVYGFGVILYMALTGRAPHEARSMPELIYKIALNPVMPVHTLRPELPEALSAVVGRAIAKQREERTANLELLIGELTPFAEQTSTLTTRLTNGMTDDSTRAAEQEQCDATVHASRAIAQGSQRHEPPITSRSRRTLVGSALVLVPLVAILGFALRGGSERGPAAQTNKPAALPAPSASAVPTEPPTAPQPEAADAGGPPEPAIAEGSGVPAPEQNVERRVSPREQNEKVVPMRTRRAPAGGAKAEPPAPAPAVQPPGSAVEARDAPARERNLGPPPEKSRKPVFKLGDFVPNQP
ncbi:MAG: hypothetical protein RLZZ450_5860 [Pseudomonadota bacterium]|jgi:serine/threonine-protein kinase